MAIKALKLHRSVAIEIALFSALVHEMGGPCPTRPCVADHRLLWNLVNDLVVLCHRRRGILLLCFQVVSVGINKLVQWTGHQLWLRQTPGDCSFDLASILSPSSGARVLKVLILDYVGLLRLLEVHLVGSSASLVFALSKG